MWPPGRGSRAPLCPSFLALEPEVGKGSQGGLDSAGCPLPLQRLTGQRRLPQWAPAQRGTSSAGEVGMVRAGGGHPAILSLTQPHFQKFFPPVRRGKRRLESLLGCREKDGQVGTRVPRGLTSQAGAMGPLAWAKGQSALRQSLGPSQRCQKN